MQTKTTRDGWQGHFGDKARIQNDLDKLDEMAPNTEVKHKLGTTARHFTSAGGTDCSHPGWERMEAWSFFLKGAGIMADIGQGSVMRRHGVLQLCTIRGMVSLLT